MKTLKWILLGWVAIFVIWLLFISFVEGPIKLRTIKKHIPNEGCLSETEYVDKLVSHVKDEYSLVVSKDNHYVFDSLEVPPFLDICGAWIAMRMDVYYEEEYVTYTYYLGEPRVIYDEAVCDVDPDALTTSAWSD